MKYKHSSELMHLPWTQKFFEIIEKHKKIRTYDFRKIVQEFSMYATKKDEEWVQRAVQNGWKVN